MQAGSTRVVSLKQESPHEKQDVDLILCGPRMFSCLSVGF